MIDYDYSANIGTPLTVTITGVVADNWNVNQDSYGLEPGVATDVSTWSSWRTLQYDTEGHFVDFPDNTVQVMRLAAPEVTWEGKTISWDTVTGAESYDLFISSPGPSSNPGWKIETTTTDTSIDLTDFIEHNGSGRYSVSVRAKLGNVISNPGQEVKYYYRIEVYPAFKALGETYPEIGTTGGTVAPEAASGDEFTGPDDNGKYTGLFAEGDKITVTSTPADNYSLAEMYDGSTKITPVQEEYGFIVENNSYINARFWENEPDPVTVTLDMGSGHEDFAAAVLAAYKEAYADEVDVDQASLDSFVLTLLIPYPATTVANGREFLDDLIEEVIAGDRMDEGECYYNIGTETIDGYDSEADYFNKMSETYSQDLEDGQEYHALWFKTVDELELSVVPPVCGTEVTMEGYDLRTVSSQPELSVTDDVFKVLQMQMSMDPTDTMPYVFWAGENGDPLRNETILGGQTYLVQGYLEAAFGFMLSEDATVTLNGEELTAGEDYGAEGLTGLGISAPIEAEHDPGDWEPKEGDPTREVQKCTHCGEILDERDATATVKLIASPMDGSKLVDNYTLTIPYGWSTGAFFNNNPDAYQAARSHFNVDGYPLFDNEIYLLDNPYSSFSSSSEVSEADRWNLVITEDTTFYVAMDTIISEVDVTVEPPICGTETSFEVGNIYYVINPDSAVNMPSVTIETEGVATYE